MPFPMKIQPIDYTHTPREWARYEPAKPSGKWRFRRLFERQLPNKPSEKAAGDETHHCCNRDGSGSSNEFDPSSACLAKMVQNFIEGDRQSTVRCGRNRCNCFNGNGNDDSGDELDGFFGSGGGESSRCLFSSSGEPCEVLKGLVPCASVAEWNLLADATKIIDKNKISKRKDQFCRKIVVDGLVELGYDASICTSRWDQAASYPSGEYEYVDVMTEGDRFLIDIDFRSEFEIARPTKSYKAVLQTLPHVFVGRSDRLQKIVAVATEAAKQSMKKKGMPVPPWRRSGYVNAKWVSPHTRTGGTSVVLHPSSSSNHPQLRNLVSGKPPNEAHTDSGELVPPSLSSIPGDKLPPAKEWQPPAVKPKSLPIGVKIVTGLASVIGEKP